MLLDQNDLMIKPLPLKGEGAGDRVDFDCILAHSQRKPVKTSPNLSPNPLSLTGKGGTARHLPTL